MDLSQSDAMNIVTEIKGILGRDINIIEKDGVILASTNRSRVGTVHEGARRLIEQHLPEYTVWEDDAASGVQRGINLPILLNGKVEGVIGVTGDPAEISEFGAVIQRLMEIMLESLRQRRRLAQMDSARDAFLEALLYSDGAADAELFERARLLGFHPESRCSAAVLRPVSEAGADTLSGLAGQKLLTHVRRAPLPGSGGHCAIVRGEFVLLCNAPRDELSAFMRSLCAEAEERCGGAMAAGIGGRAENFSALRRSFREAHAAVRAAVASGTGGRVFFYDQVSLEYIAESIPKNILDDLEATVFSGCTEEEKRDFQSLLRMYFAQDGDLHRCAEALYLHRNTVQYRLDRIRDRTGYDFRKLRDAFLLYLASHHRGT